MAPTPVGLPMTADRTPPLPTMRLMGRVCISFVLDSVKIGRGGHDLIDALILLAIVQSNIAPLARDADLQRTYATYDEPPPDEIRRPVSMNAIAHSLRFPYETVRRRVSQLASQGECEITRRGVYVPAVALATPEHLATLEASYELVRNLYWRLREIGGLGELPAPTTPWAGEGNGGAAPLRLVARHSSDYFLRVMEGLRQRVGGLVEGLILMDILRANTEHLTDLDRGTEEDGARGFVPDEQRRAVRVTALAARLDLPEETVRRHVAQLIKEERCVRWPEGIVVPTYLMVRPQVAGMLRDNLIALHRMFTALAQLGILEEWDRQRPSPPSGA
ncbi:MAG: hypothetical protein ABI655_06375 [Phenylobacterium sp.]